MSALTDPVFDGLIALEDIGNHLHWIRLARTYKTKQSDYTRWEKVELANKFLKLTTVAAK